MRTNAAGFHGAVHASDENVAPMILDHLRGQGHAWLSQASAAMTAATLQDWHAFRDGTDVKGFAKL